jgi:hypothetical protein
MVLNRTGAVGLGSDRANGLPQADAWENRCAHRRKFLAVIASYAVSWHPSVGCRDDCSSAIATIFDKQA